MPHLLPGTYVPFPDLLLAYVKLKRFLTRYMCRLCGQAKQRPAGVPVGLAGDVGVAEGAVGHDLSDGRWRRGERYE